MPTRSLAFPVALLLFASLAEAQTAVRIVEVPKRQFLPTAVGSNLLLAVECTTPPAPSSPGAGCSNATASSTRWPTAATC